MSASRIRVTGVCCSARFWLSACSAALMPTSIGYQDIAALIAREHAAPSHWHLIISPVQAATFSYSRPIGSAIPQPLGFQVVNFDPRSLDAFSWKIDEPIHARRARQIEYPTVERSHKADRLPASVIAPAVSDNAPAAARAPAALTAPVAAHVEQTAPATNNLANNAPPVPTAPTVTALDSHDERAALAVAGPAHDSAAPAVDAATAPQISPPQAPQSPPQAEPAPPQAKLATAADEEDVGLADKPPEIPPPSETEYGSALSLSGMSFLDADAADRKSAIYFGGGVIGAPNRLQSWAPGAEPILVSPSAELAAQSADSNIKLSALEGSDNDTGAGESVAGKEIGRAHV